MVVSNLGWAFRLLPVVCCTKTFLYTSPYRSTFSIVGREKGGHCWAQTLFHSIPCLSLLSHSVPSHPISSHSHALPAPLIPFTTITISWYQVMCPISLGALGVYKRESDSCLPRSLESSWEGRHEIRLGSKLQSTPVTSRGRGTGVGVVLRKTFQLSFYTHSGVLSGWQAPQE